MQDTPMVKDDTKHRGRRALKPIALALFAIVLLVALSACGPQYRVESQPTAPPESTSEPADDRAAPESDAYGRVVFAISDAAADMQTVTSITLVVNAVRVHSTAEGWVTASSTPQTYDLLQLKATGSQALIADTKLKPGSYDQIRLDMSSVTVTDSTGVHQAKLPSGELKITGKFDVVANTTTTATFDFIADESLHITGNGEYILAPVVQLETREHVEVVVHPDRKVEIAQENVRTRVKVGMDINGNVGVDSKISKNQAIFIEGGKLKLGDSSISAQGSAKGNAGLGVIG